MTIELAFVRLRGGELAAAPGAEYVLALCDEGLERAAYEYPNHPVWLPREVRVLAEMEPKSSRAAVIMAKRELGGRIVSSSTVELPDGQLALAAGVTRGG